MPVAGNRLPVPDLTDPKTYVNEDMALVWRRLRDEDPFHWHPETIEHPGFWVLTRYADIEAVLGDSANFTSEGGNVLATMLAGGDPGAGRMLAVTDGQRHAELRRVLMRAFSPRVLESVGHRVRRTVRRLLAEMAQRGQCDFATDVASVIPLQTICDLLDVPVADRNEVLALTKAALASDYETPETDADRIARASILEYFSELVADRRDSPGDDPISLMAAAKVAGRRLDDEDIILNCYSLIMGGDETSRLTMIGAVQAFIEHPDQWAALRNGTVTVASATEEALRWTTPTMHFGRTATADARVGGQMLSAGDLVTLWLVSGNRDERVFPEPGRFNLSRSPNKHLSLGYGPHFCLGAYLGRVEINAMLDALRTFVSGIDAAGQAQRIYSNFIAGFCRLPITLTYDKEGISRWQD
jgi:cytochrome P450